MHQFPIRPETPNHAPERTGASFRGSRARRRADVAVLIDADNAQAAVIGDLLLEVSRFGVASVKRAYGDWTTQNLASWKSQLHKHAIQPIQQFTYTSGKNATDSALIIDAMDLLHSGHLDGFCLVSSDSDFTSLAALKNNLRANCLPISLLDGGVPDYDMFLAERRLLMAKKIRDWFEAL